MTHVTLRRVGAADLDQIRPFAFTVSITEPLTDRTALEARFEDTGFWREDAGALAIEVGGELVGTCQFYRSAPCIHGYEIGYIIHDTEKRGRGYATEALRRLTDLLFDERPNCHRLQLVIEVANLPSAKVAETCGYVREGLLRSAGFDLNNPSDCFVYSMTRKERKYSRP